MGLEHLFYQYVGNFKFENKNVKIVFDIDENQENLSVDEVAKNVFQAWFNNFEQKYKEV